MDNELLDDVEMQSGDEIVNLPLRVQTIVAFSWFAQFVIGCMIIVYTIFALTIAIITVVLVLSW